MRWLLSDQQQSVRDVLDAGGAAVDHLVYDSYGTLTGRTGAGPAPRFRYAGMEWDAEAGGQYYARRRYYDGRLGRSVSQDPIAFEAGDGNLYRYVSNNPVNRVDPSGLVQKWQIWDEAKRGSSSGTTATSSAPDDSRAIQHKMDNDPHFRKVVEQTYGAKADYYTKAGEPITTDLKDDFYAEKARGEAAGRKADRLGVARDVTAATGDAIVPGFEQFRGAMGSEFAADENSTAYGVTSTGVGIATTVVGVGAAGRVAKAVDKLGDLQDGVEAAAAAAKGDLVGAATAVAPVNLPKGAKRGEDVRTPAGAKPEGCFLAGTPVLVADDGTDRLASSEPAPADADAAAVANGPETRADDPDVHRGLGLIAVGIIGACSIYSVNRLTLVRRSREALAGLRPVELPLRHLPTA